MRALVLAEIGTMKVTEIPAPVAGPGQVVIDVVATGICGSDLHGYTGENGRRFPGQVMGHESVGRIRTVGDGVQGLAAGLAVTFNPLTVSEESRRRYAGREQHAPDRVVLGVEPSLPAAFAEQICVPAVNVVPIPDGVPLVWGALVEPLAVALNAVNRAEVAAGERVLVIGGGPIGQSCILAAQHRGASAVYVSEPDASRRELCGQLGAVAFDPGDGPLAEQLAAVDGTPVDGPGSAGPGVDVALDAVGISATLQDALSATVLGGRIVLVGMGAPSLEVSAYRISTEERTVIGSFCYSFDVFREAAQWLGEPGVAFDRLISQEVSLDDGPGAFARLAATPDVPGKVLVRLDR